MSALFLVSAYSGWKYQEQQFYSVYFILPQTGGILSYQREVYDTLLNLNYFIQNLDLNNKLLHFLHQCQHINCSSQLYLFSFTISTYILFCFLLISFLHILLFSLSFFFLSFLLHLLPPSLISSFFFYIKWFLIYYYFFLFSFSLSSPLPDSIIFSTYFL
jgi:hypothetical protein